MTDQEMAGLIGEVKTTDCYGLRRLKFDPDLILDLGANWGIFAKHARECFPDAKIVCVEPDPDNFRHLSEIKDAKTILINKAIGSGKVFREPGAANGAHECYLSSGLGYDFGGRGGACNVRCVMLDELARDFFRPDDKIMIKLDVEGSENHIFAHPPSMQAMARADYIAAELHWFAETAEKVVEVRDVTNAGIKFLSKTHDCSRDGQIFFALKR